MTLPPSVSFEFFPPHDEAAEEKLWDVVRGLESLRPAFVSVTYGAGGSTRSRTDRIVRRIHRETDVSPAAHLTCVGATRAETDALAHRWWDAGIRQIVALRGDPPKGAERYTPHPDGYENAADLVAGLRRIADFDISVAAYPECHPDSPSPEADLENLKRKLANGASRAITQYFFDNGLFLRFRDAAAAAGIDVPIIPGILPVTNFARVVEFSERCGASVPDSMAALFEGLDADPETRQLIAAATAVRQCEELRREGVDDFHFYTLNRAALTKAICWDLGVRPARAQAVGGRR
jgi:methylenetetrahydrofolate reductase (NADPH)